MNVSDAQMAHAHHVIDSVLDTDERATRAADLRRRLDALGASEGYEPGDMAIETHQHAAARATAEWGAGR